jgi:hypothetical protein
METLFDHHPTEQELTHILGDPDVRDTREEYLQFMESDGANADLFRLFILRDDRKAAVRYLNRIQEVSYRESVDFPECHDHGHHRRDPERYDDGQDRSAA